MFRWQSQMTDPSLTSTSDRKSVASRRSHARRSRLTAQRLQETSTLASGFIYALCWLAPMLFLRETIQWISGILFLIGCVSYVWSNTRWTVIHRFFISDLQFIPLTLFICPLISIICILWDYLYGGNLHSRRTLVLNAVIYWLCFIVLLSNESAHSAHTTIFTWVGYPVTIFLISLIAVAKSFTSDESTFVIRRYNRIYEYSESDESWSELSSFERQRLTERVYYRCTLSQIYRMNEYVLILVIFHVLIQSIFGNKSGRRFLREQMSVLFDIAGFCCCRNNELRNRMKEASKRRRSKTKKKKYAARKHQSPNPEFSQRMLESKSVFSNNNNNNYNVGSSSQYSNATGTIVNPFLNDDDYLVVNCGCCDCRIWSLDLCWGNCSCCLCQCIVPLDRAVGGLFLRHGGPSSQIFNADSSDMSLRNRALTPTSSASSVSSSSTSTYSSSSVTSKKNNHPRSKRKRRMSNSNNLYMRLLSKKISRNQWMQLSETDMILEQCGPMFQGRNLNRGLGLSMPHTLGIGGGGIAGSNAFGTSSSAMSSSGGSRSMSMAMIFEQIDVPRLTQLTTISWVCQFFMICSLLWLFAAHFPFAFFESDFMDRSDDSNHKNNSDDNSDSSSSSTLAGDFASDCKIFVSVFSILLFIFVLSGLCIIKLHFDFKLCQKLVTSMAYLPCLYGSAVIIAVSLNLVRLIHVWKKHRKASSSNDSNDDDDDNDEHNQRSVQVFTAVFTCSVIWHLCVVPTVLLFTVLFDALNQHRYQLPQLSANDVRDMVVHNDHHHHHHPIVSDEQTKTMNTSDQNSLQQARNTLTGHTLSSLRSSLTKSGRLNTALSLDPSRLQTTTNGDIGHRTRPSKSSLLQSRGRVMMNSSPKVPPHGELLSYQRPTQHTYSMSSQISTAVLEPHPPLGSADNLLSNPLNLSDEMDGVDIAEAGASTKIASQMSRARHLTTSMDKNEEEESSFTHATASETLGSDVNALNQDAYHVYQDAEYASSTATDQTGDTGQYTEDSTAAWIAAGLAHIGFGQTDCHLCCHLIHRWVFPFPTWFYFRSVMHGVCIIYGILCILCTWIPSLDYHILVYFGYSAAHRVDFFPYDSHPRFVFNGDGVRYVYTGRRRGIGIFWNEVTRLVWLVIVGVNLMCLLTVFYDTSVCCQACLTCGNASRQGGVNYPPNSSSSSNHGNNGGLKTGSSVPRNGKNHQNHHDYFTLLSSHVSRALIETKVRLIERENAKRAEQRAQEEYSRVSGAMRNVVDSRKNNDDNSDEDDHDVSEDDSPFVMDHDRRDHNNRARVYPALPPMAPGMNTNSFDIIRRKTEAVTTQNLLLENSMVGGGRVRRSHGMLDETEEDDDTLGMDDDFDCSYRAIDTFEDAISHRRMDIFADQSDVLNDSIDMLSLSVSTFDIYKQRRDSVPKPF